MLTFFVVICGFAYDCVERVLTLICAGDSLHTRVVIPFSSCGQLRGGARCYCNRSSFWIRGYFDHWLPRSAYRQRVTMLLLLALLSPVCMPSILYYGHVSWNYCTSKLCRHFTFLWWRRCMLWIDFRADNKLNGTKETSVCARRFALPFPNDLPLRMFLSLNHHDRDDNE